MKSAAPNGVSVVVTVELFGLARVRAGVSSVCLTVDAQTPVTELLGALAQECPDLVGSALCLSDRGTISVADGYALNRNGLAFLSPEIEAPLDWAPGDSLLLLSNQAGG